jgi:hypothetical protein
MLILTLLRISLVPHSKFSCKENPKFWQNFKSKITQLEKNFHQYLVLIFDITIQAWYSKAKLLNYFIKLGVFHKRKFIKLMLKTHVSFVDDPLSVKTYPYKAVLGTVQQQSCHAIPNELGNTPHLPENKNKTSIYKKISFMI